MRILGLVGTFDELAGADRRVGRKVAGFGLTAALIQHLDFDELHCFLPFPSAGPRFEAAYAPWLQRARPRVRLFPALALAGQLQGVEYTALHATEVDRYLPELCHLRNRLAARPCPVTATPHTLSYWSSRVRGLYKVLPGPRTYDSIFCTSRAAMDHLAAAFATAAGELRGLGLMGAGYAGRLDLVPLGVDAAEFGRETQAAARQALGLPAEGLAFLCLGRLNPKDKFDLLPLMAALAQVNRRTPCRLILAGAEEAGYGRALMATAQGLGLKDRVHLFADFASAVKARLFAAADVFVSPADNLQETFGLSILEAMAAGRPVAAADYSGYRDLVAEGETGFLVPTLGPSAGAWAALDAAWPLMGERESALQVAQRTAVDFAPLLERLGRLAADPALRGRLGAAGRARVEQHFAWPKVIARMAALWTELKAAAQAAPPAPPGPDVLGAGLGRLFGGFFSAALGPDDDLCAGPLAADFQAGNWAASAHPEAAPGLPRAGLKDVLAAITAAGGAMSLAGLQAALAGRLHPEQVEHLALFGLKYGVLARGTGPQAARPGI
ncbi:MAG: glycosyltransferase family 4 protein [Pseudomonadota bacterium]